ncbi:MAG: hypothetical protein ACTSRZ_12030 [Promethearchaeota archaeon]
MSNIVFHGSYLPSFLEDLIDKAVSLDFEVQNLTQEDYKNKNYNSLKYSLEFSGANILYERKVISRLAPVIPSVQYLFGFSPLEGLCIFTSNKVHKKMLCNNESFGDIVRASISFVHKLQYLLVEQNRFNVWFYIPLNPEKIKNDSNEENRLTLEMRKILFTNE